jgi:hypothetical protein
MYENGLTTSKYSLIFGLAICNVSTALLVVCDSDFEILVVEVESSLS